MLQSLPLLSALAFAAPSPLPPDKIFPPDAVVNVTLAPYNAKPDDNLDDTAAIQKAITDNVDTGRTLYFPAGVYNLSDTLVAKNKEGIWRAHLTLQGQSSSKTILRLNNGAPGFNDPAHPKALIMTGSYWETGDSPDGGGNKAFRNNLFDLTLDTGSDNPGAVGVDWAVSNQGAIQNVLIRSGDGQGVAGISAKRRIPGPGLIKGVEITGFDVGIDVGDIQYGLTLEDITLRNLKVAGIRTDKNQLYIRHLDSDNRVPAVLITGFEGNVLLLESKLLGGTPDQCAIESQGNLLLRNVSTSGYRPTAVKNRGNEAAGPLYGQWSWPTPMGDTKNITALLPIEETPNYWNSKLADWSPVGKRQEGEKDDTAAIQRAIDSGKSTVYFPNNRVYYLSDTVVVRGAVRQILGMGSEINLGAARQPFSDIANPRPLFRIDSTKRSELFIENVFFNAQYPGEVLIENNSPATLVIKHCAGWVGADGHRRSYRNTAKANGKVFLEDVFLPGWEFKDQKVWARQFNPENWDSNGTEPQVSNSGGGLWILGFKTEGAAPFLATTTGGQTELLGAYNYISATKADKVPADAVPYPIKNATTALSFTAENFRSNDYNTYIRNEQGDQIQELKGSDLAPRNGRPGDRSFVVSLYRSETKLSP